MYQLQTFTFPSTFKFGIADADLQVIGEKSTLKHENSEMTMWTHLARTSGKVYENHTPLEGIDRFYRWKEDIKLMKELGSQHYRTSISIARVMTRDRKPNNKALEWYKRYFTAIKKARISIYATLYHWELPLYLHQIGGWKNREIVNYLTEHAKIVYTHLGKYIDEYFILNEPFQFTLDSYHNAVDAPFERSLKGGLVAVHHALLTQGMIYKMLKSLDKKVKLSTTYNPMVTYAASSTKNDLKAAKYAWGYHTGIFTDPLYLGMYPDYMARLFGNNMPKIKNGDMKTIKVGSGLHSFGINFYLGKTVQYNSKSENKFVDVRYPQGISNGLKWPVYLPPTYPEALYDLLRGLYQRYENHGMKQIVITESGTCWNNQINEKGEVDDEFRVFFYKEHFKQVAKAILSGIPIKGYFVWTLMDNFEWTSGYRPEAAFGIVHVDRKTLKRTPKKSYYWYKEVIKSRTLV